MFDISNETIGFVVLFFCVIAFFIYISKYGSPFSQTQKPTQTESPTSTQTPSETQTESPTSTQTPSETQTPSTTQTPTETQTPSTTQSPISTQTPTETQSSTPLPINKLFPSKRWDKFNSNMLFFYINSDNNMLDTYEVGYSSVYDSATNRNPMNIFNSELDTRGGGPSWANNNYTNGIYNGTISLNNSYKGDYIYIRLPKSIKLTKYTFTARPGLVQRAPGEWKIYGSIDGVTWNEISEASVTNKIGITDYNSSNQYTKTVTTDSLYNYFGLVVNKTADNSTILNFYQWQIYGDILNTQNTQNTSTIDTERLYSPNKRWNRKINNTAFSIDTAEYGNGIYEVEYSSVYDSATNRNPINIFNPELDTTGGGPSWANNNYINGIYNGTISLNNSYKGDYIYIRLPKSIKLTKYTFTARPGFVVRAPGEWKIYGSIDGMTWNEISEASVTNKIDITDYNSSNQYTKTVTTDTSYNYFGLVVNKTAGNSTILNLYQWQIYGI